MHSEASKQEKFPEGLPPTAFGNKDLPLIKPACITASQKWLKVWSCNVRRGSQISVTADIPQQTNAWPGTHRERLGTFLDNKAFDQVRQDVGLVYGLLSCFAVSIVLAAVSAPIPRGHDWSTGRPKPVNTTATYNCLNLKECSNIEIQHSRCVR